MNSSIDKWFAPYLDLQERLADKYATVVSRFPNAFYALENEVRIYEAQRDNFERVVWRNFGRKTNTKSRRSFFLSKFSSISERHAEKPTFVCEVGRVRQVGDAVSNFLISQGFESFRPKNFSVEACSLTDIATCGIPYDLLANSIFPNFENLTKNKPLMTKLEKIVSKNIDELVKLMTRSDLRIIVTHVCHNLAGRLIARAAKKANVMVVEIAHGFTMSPCLISVAPIEVDLQVVWTQRLASRIQSVLPVEDRSRVRSFGFLKASIRTVPKSTALVLIDPISRKNLWERQKYLRILDRLVSAFQSLNLSVVLRLHPSETERQNSTAVDLNSRFGLAASTNTLESDLVDATIVAGSQSSVLVEAVYNGIPAMQITELAIGLCDGSHMIDEDAITPENIANVISSPLDKPLPFCIESFKNALSSGLKCRT